MSLLQPNIFAITQGKGGGGDSSTVVIDNLESTSISSALSANQGKVLDEKVTKVAEDLVTHDNGKVTDVDGVHGIRYYEKKLQIKDENDEWIDIVTEDMNVPLLAHYDEYTALENQISFDITLPTYIPEMGTFVFKNTTLQPPTNYTIELVDGTYKVILDSAMENDIIDIKVIYGGVEGGNIVVNRDVYTTTSGQTTFPISSSEFNLTTPIVVFKNTALLPITNYTISQVNNQYRVNIPNVVEGDLIDISTYYGATGLEINRNEYIANNGNKSFPIRLNAYNPMMPTLVYKGTVILPDFAFDINKIGDGYQVTIPTIEDGQLVQILILENVGSSAGGNQGSSEWIRF